MYKVLNDNVILFFFSFFVMSKKKYKEKLLKKYKVNINDNKLDVI